MTETASEISVRDARASFADVVNRVSVHGETIYLLSRGRRVAAIVPLSSINDHGQTEDDRD